MTLANLCGRASRAALTSGLVAAISCAAALAQPYPSKPVRLYSQYGAGAPGDIFTRLYAGALGNLLGQPVVVEGRAGGGGLVAAGLAARAEPDGYSLAALSANVSISSALPTKTPPPIDSLRDLSPVAMLAEPPGLLAAGSSLPVSNMQELIAYARKNPGKLVYGTTGIGSSHHLNGEQVSMLSGTQMLHVPYKALPMVDVVSGVLPLVYGIAGQALPFIRAGKIKALAMTTDRRNASLPDVPLMRDLLPGFEPAPAWNGLYGPAKLQAAVLKRLHDDTVTALSGPEIQSKARELGFEVTLSNSPEDFAQRVRRGYELTARIAKSAKIETE